MNQTQIAVVDEYHRVAAVKYAESHSLPFNDTVFNQECGIGMLSYTEIYSETKAAQQGSA